MSSNRLQWSFLLTLALCLAFAPAARAQTAEVEPNNLCIAAQDLTAASLPLSVNGSLDSPPTIPDVDFYRISGAPGGLLRVRLQGSSSGQGTLVDPMLGAFSDDCATLLAFNDDFRSLDSELDVVVPASGTIVLAATGYSDYSFTGEGGYSGSYRLAAEEREAPAHSISGRAVDADTGSPLSGADVTLYRCDGGICAESIGWAYTGPDGEFLFENGAYNLYSPLYPGDYQVRINIFNYETGQFGPFTVSSGQALNLGDLGLAPLPRIGSIRGRLVDAVTGEPLPSAAPPYATIELLYCDPEPSCYGIRYASAGADGTFLFEGDPYNPLFAGTYKLVVYADQYETTLSEPFQVANGQHFDYGNLAVKSLPVRIYLDQSCGAIPAEGGNCQFKMRVVNGASSRFIGEAWSIVYGSQTGTPAQSTAFQTGTPKGVSLATGASSVIPLSFFVPANISNGAYICAEGFAAQRPHSFNTLGRHYLFCLVKGAYGFSLVPEDQKHEAVRRMKGEPAHPNGRR